jgi:hypothetical protein
MPIVKIRILLSFDKGTKKNPYRQILNEKNSEIFFLKKGVGIFLNRKFPEKKFCGNIGPYNIDQKKFLEKFREHHHTPLLGGIRGGTTRGVTGGGVQGEPWACQGRFSCLIYYL